MSISFAGRVAIVTGAGQGLGRGYALELARRGAKVVVNDLGGARDGSGGSGEVADAVVGEIRRAGGEAVADGADVADYGQVSEMVRRTVERWGRVDVLVNNAGILRDKTFAKMDLADFRRVVDVHLMGSVHCTKAVWEGMRERQYGRIVMTTSSSGLYGNFGQSNYGAAKMALVGLMNCLVPEGAKYGIRVNAVAPIAATRMTADLKPQNVLALLDPQAVVPAVVFLASEQAPTRQILVAGAGGYARLALQETPGIFLAPAERDAEHVAALWERIAATDGQSELQAGSEQTVKFLEQAAQALGIEL